MVLSSAEEHDRVTINCAFSVESTETVSKTYTFDVGFAQEFGLPSVFDSINGMHVGDVKQFSIDSASLSKSQHSWLPKALTNLQSVVFAARVEEICKVLCFSFPWMSVPRAFLVERVFSIWLTMLNVLAYRSLESFWIRKTVLRKESQRTRERQIQGLFKDFMFRRWLQI